IEAALQQQPGVSGAVVAPQESSEGLRLVAYVVKNNKLTVRNLHDCLAKRMPAYMLPGIYVELKELPLTANGKIDRKRLPNPDSGVLALGNEYVAPRTRVEEILADIWSGLLDVKKIGVHDNFFTLGGHSLLALRLVSRIREQLQAEYSLA